MIHHGDGSRVPFLWLALMGAVSGPNSRRCDGPDPLRRFVAMHRRSAHALDLNGSEIACQLGHNNLCVVSFDEV